MKHTPSCVRRDDAPARRLAAGAAVVLDLPDLSMAGDEEDAVPALPSGGGGGAAAVARPALDTSSAQYLEWKQRCAARRCAALHATSPADLLIRCLRALAFRLHFD